MAASIDNAPPIGLAGYHPLRANSATTAGGANGYRVASGLSTDPVVNMIERSTGRWLVSWLIGWSWRALLLSLARAAMSTPA